MSDGNRAEGLVMSDELLADADIVSLPGPRLSAAACGRARPACAGSGIRFLMS